MATRNEAEGIKWYRTAADEGYAEGQYTLGQCYYNGDGVIEDKVEAVKWYRMAAEQGLADSQK